MNSIRLLRLALRGVNTNRTRSFLTVLGILIGVASVIVLVSVGNGSAIAVAKRFDALGTNTLTVLPGGFGRGARQGGGAQLSMKDVVALRDPEYKSVIRNVVPVVSAQSIVGTYAESTTTVARVTGTEPEMVDAGNWDVQSGRYFDNGEVEDRQRVVVIGARVADNLFGTEIQPVGQQISLSNIAFEIVGVLTPKGSSGNNDQDDIAFIPITTAQDTLVGRTNLNQIVVQATSRKTTTDAQGAVTTVLSSRYPSNNGSSFAVLNQASLLQSSNDSSKTLTVLLAAVAAISLLVGGIGIMNIMLVTVTERTREIGIRKAVGAPKGAILGQFLFEASVLGAVGGALGVAVGLIGSRFKVAGTVPVVRWDSVALALFVAVAISVFFGFYPANRAASMRPIDALRHE